MNPKGDLAAETADWRADVLGQEVVVLDPFKVTCDRIGERYLGGFNPLTLLSPDSPTLLEDAGLIADALIVTSGGEKNPHWNESARLFLTGVILHIATSHAYIGERHLVSVYKYITKLDSHLEGEMLSNDAAYEAVQDAAVSFFSKPDEERGSILSTLRRHIYFIGLPSIQKALTDHSFDLNQLKTKKLTI